jgi:signal transduction histidine kinase
MTSNPGLQRFPERAIRLALSAGFLLVILLLGATAVVAVGHSSRIRRSVTEITRDQLVISRLVHDIQQGENAMVQLLIKGTRQDLTAPERQQLLERLDEIRRQGTLLQAESQDLPDRGLWTRFNDGVARFTDSAHRIHSLPTPHPPELLDTLFRAHEEILSLADSIVDASFHRLTEIEQDIDLQSKELGDSSIFLLGLSVGLSILCALVTMLLVGRSIRVMRWQTDELNRVSRHMLQTQEEAARRFSHELHDELGQSLAALRSNLTQEGHKDPQAVRTDCLMLVDESIRNVRELSQLLRPVILDDLGLQAGLRWLALKSSERLGIRVGFESNGDERLPEEVETHLFRICQEALTNIARHSGASEASIRLEMNPGSVVLMVEDDGRGLPDPTQWALPQSGLGMTSMRARARMLGGELEVLQRQPSGLRLRVEIPRTVPGEG